MTNHDIVDQLEQWLVDEIRHADNMIHNRRDAALFPHYCGIWAAYALTLHELRQLRSQQDTDK